MAKNTARFYLNSNWISISGSGGYTSDTTKAAIQTAFNALPNNCMRLGILISGDFGGLIIVKASNSYGTIIRIGYANTAYPADLKSMNVYNGEWGSWRSV